MRDLPSWEIWNSLWSRYLKAHAFIYCILCEQLTHKKFAYALSFCLECKCINGRCKEGLDGDGSCTCDLGWRGINCNVGMMLTCRTNAHITYIWMPCTIGVYIKCENKRYVDFSAITSNMCGGKCHSSAK